MSPLGYVLIQPSKQLSQPVSDVQFWSRRLPQHYAESVMGEPRVQQFNPEIGTARNYRNLMSLARDAGKPMFDLQAADGAIGSTQRLVRICLQEYRALAREILNRLDPAISRSTA